jgi:hypothetical protein
MRPSAEATPQDRSNDDASPLLRRVFGRTESERQKDPRHAEDTADDRTAELSQPEDQRYADEPATDDERHDEVARHDDDTSATPSDREPEAFDEPARHEPAVAAPEEDESAEFRPGDAPATEVTPMWTDDSTQELRERWHQAQLRFIDDPKKAADDTRDLVNETVETLTAALASHHEQLNSWPDNLDTEQYRMIVQRYRTFFERLLTV